MAIEAKADFLNQLEAGIGDLVTASALPQVMARVADLLVFYKMENGPRDWTEDSEDLIDYYITAMSVKGLSEKTLVRYEYILRRVVDGIGVPCRRITVHHLRSWLAKEKERGISERTLKGDRDVLSAFFGWVHRESLIERNPVANLDPIKCPKKKKLIYSAVELEKLHQRSARETRDRAIIAFLESSGCRVGELVKLNRDQVNLDKGEVVVHGKGNKERIAFIDDVTTMLLRQYLAERKDSDEALFVGLRGGGRLTENGVRVMLNRVAAGADLTKVHPHKFRRTFATNAARRGMPIQEVAALLGHEKIDTTMTYVVLDNDDIKMSHRRYMQ